MFLFLTERMRLSLSPHPQNSVIAPDQIVKALQGDYRAEHLFALQTALELYDTYQLKITACESKIEQQLEQFDTKLDLKEA